MSSSPVMAPMTKSVTKTSGRSPSSRTARNASTGSENVLVRKPASDKTVSANCPSKASSSTIKMSSFKPLALALMLSTEELLGGIPDVSRSICDKGDPLKFNALGDLGDVSVAAAGEVDDHELVFAHFGGEF